MTEFYQNLRPEDIENLINFKMRIYGKDFEYMKMHDILIKPDDFIFQSYAKYHDINIEEYKLYRYIGISQGQHLYEFYNLIKKN